MAVSKGANHAGFQKPEGIVPEVEKSDEQIWRSLAQQTDWVKEETDKGIQDPARPRPSNTAGRSASVEAKLR